MEEAWVLDLRDQCVAANVAFFFKQWGALHSKSGGRLLAGEVYDEMLHLSMHVCRSTSGFDRLNS